MVGTPQTGWGGRESAESPQFYYHYSKIAPLSIPPIKHLGPTFFEFAKHLGPSFWLFFGRCLGMYSGPVQVLLGTIVPWRNHGTTVCTIVPYRYHDQYFCTIPWYMGCKHLDLSISGPNLFSGTRVCQIVRERLDAFANVVRVKEERG